MWQAKVCSLMGWSTELRQVMPRRDLDMLVLSQKVLVAVRKVTEEQ